MAAELLRAELETMRRKLRQAEQRGQQGEAMAAVLRTQISSLRIKLDATRDVAKAALEALRRGITIRPEAPRNTKWRTSVLRLFGFRAKDQLPLAPGTASYRS